MNQLWHLDLRDVIKHFLNWQERPSTPASAPPTLTRDERLKSLEDKLNDIHTEHDGYHTKISELEADLERLKKSHAIEIEKIKREQTEADIMFGAAKLIQDMLNKTATVGQGASSLADLNRIYRASIVTPDSCGSSSNGNGGGVIDSSLGPIQWSSGSPFFAQRITTF